MACRGTPMPWGRANESGTCPSGSQRGESGSIFMGHGVVGGSEPDFVFLRKVDGLSILPLR
ncbi:unnamed protein product [Ectocarpus sp. 12 AP-2014]